MDKTSKVFVEVLRNYINGVSCSDIDFSDVDWKKLDKLITIHGVAGICYSCLKDCNIDKDLLKNLGMFFFKEIAYYQKRVVALESFKNLLNENNIDHVCVKGSQIALLYPNPELRSMSDLDILIRKEDRERSHEALSNDGAKYNIEKNNGDVWVYNYKGINFEVHTNLVANKNIINNVDYHGYFSKTIEHIDHVEKNTYILEENFNMIYTIYHISKHFRFSGCGVRMLMDLPILIRNSSEALDWDYVWQELDKLKIKKFTARLFKICEEWFGTMNVEYPKDIVIEEKAFVEEFILSGGVFGGHGRNTDVYKIKSFGNKEKGGFNYYKGLFRWAFPSCEKMRNYSEWFRDKPAIFLPIAYAQRFIDNAKERGGIFKWGNDIAKGKRDLDEKQVMLSVMELE